MGHLRASPAILACGAIVVVVMLAQLSRSSPASQIAFGGTLGDALGNVVDRAQHGYVLDYTAIPYVYAFNFAAAYISSGVATTAFVALRERA